MNINTKYEILSGIVGVVGFLLAMAGAVALAVFLK